jgi:hypothetical protein
MYIAIWIMLVICITALINNYMDDTDRKCEIGGFYMVPINIEEVCSFIINVPIGELIGVSEIVNTKETADDIDEYIIELYAYPSGNRPSWTFWTMHLNPIQENSWLDVANKLCEIATEHNNKIKGEV